MLPMPATPPPTPPAYVQQVAPVTVECVYEAAERYKVPLAILVAVMDTEGGQVAKARTNSNGTRDYGPMQVNTIWLPSLKQYGITEDVLRNDGCMNVKVGAWILSQHLSKYAPWEAIGSYHSRTPHLKSAYQQRVYKRMRSIRNIQSVIDRANRSLRRK